MSHFCMGVIVPKDKTKTSDECYEYLTSIMHRFDENRTVAPYIEKTLEQLKEEFREWKNKQNENFESQKPIWGDELYETVIKSEERLSKEDIAIWVKYWYSKNMDENGNVITTYNPDSKWDWWQLGGRWNGFLTQPLFVGESVNNKKDKHIVFQENMITIQQHKRIISEKFDKYALYGLVDIKGDWYERAVMGWWGFTRDEKNEDDWQNIYKNILDNHDESDYIVLIDCHI